MATTVLTPDLQTAAPAAKLPLSSLLVVTIIAVMLAVGGCAGTLLYLSHSGRLGAAASTPPPAAKKAKAEALLTKNVALDPLLVNLADDDGHAYLRVGIVLAEEVDKAKKSESEDKPAAGADAALRDAALTVLGKKHAAELLAPNGKEVLKSQLKQAFNATAPLAKIHAVYFTDFLVQR